MSTTNNNPSLTVTIVKTKPQWTSKTGNVYSEYEVTMPDGSRGFLKVMSPASAPEQEAPKVSAPPKAQPKRAKTVQTPTQSSAPIVAQPSDDLKAQVAAMGAMLAQLAAKLG